MGGRSDSPRWNRSGKAGPGRRHTGHPLSRGRARRFPWRGPGEGEPRISPNQVRTRCFICRIAASRICFRSVRQTQRATRRAAE
jgi:hypothetical protein